MLSSVLLSGCTPTFQPFLNSTPQADAGFRSRHSSGCGLRAQEAVSGYPIPIQHFRIQSCISVAAETAELHDVLVKVFTAMRRTEAQLPLPLWRSIQLSRPEDGDKKKQIKTANFAVLFWYRDAMAEKADDFFILLLAFHDIIRDELRSHIQNPSQMLSRWKLRKINNTYRRLGISWNHFMSDMHQQA